MGSFRSKEDDVDRISTSIFVTNFSDSFTAKDLFHSCKMYGHVVDSYIPTKRSKEGKRFGFVRFINVFNVDRPVSNLCTIWVGRLKFHANLVRFQRTPLNSSKVEVKKKVESISGGFQPAHMDAGSSGRNKTFLNIVKSNNKTLTSECNSVPAIVLDDDCSNSKDLSKSLLGRVKEFASLSNLKMALSNEGFCDINVRYMGELWILLEFVSDKSKDLFCENVRAGSWFFDLRQASFDFTLEGRIIIHKGKVFWIRAKEVLEWIPDLMEEADNDDNSDMNIWKVQTMIMKWDAMAILVAFLREEMHTGGKDDTPKKNENDLNANGDNVETHTGGVEDHINSGFKEVEATESVCSGRFKQSEVPRKGGSFLRLMEEVLKVGQTMGYNMEGCVNNMTKIIASQGANSVGNSGGILCVWDPNSFRKNNCTISDSFVIIRGVWVKSGADLLITSVYAPHDPRDKRMLWDYLAHSINQWEGDVVLMGDFNEVRFKSDRFGSIFNAQGANDFNSFITNAGLEEVQIASFKEELRDLDALIDNGMGMDQVVAKIMEIISDMQHIDKLHNMDMAQKTKIKWSIEGDENSRFFHAILNKKRNQQNIRGVMIDGVWNEKPIDVKREFLLHFRNMFDKPAEHRAIIDFPFPRVLKIDQQEDLDRDVTREEIKRAVWDCGTDKSPGPDGFTFEFFWQFWSTIENDVLQVVSHFFICADIPKGCNSSFIALIPKVLGANLVKDFRPISLIGSLYKIIAKVLASRLVGVLGDIVNEVQIASFKEELRDLDALIDNGMGTHQVVAKRMEIVNDMQHIDKLHNMDMAQKAKIKWSIEGDENLPEHRAIIDFPFQRVLKIDQQEDLDRDMTREKIKMAVWDCGTDKSPGSDGFTFEFFRQFWSTIENDVFQGVFHFFIYADIPKGCNSSFIALIPKVPGANLVKDFRPISLIGSLYKIIAKVLANRLVRVLGDIVNEVDFEKAFDSVRWDFLDDVLKNFGFGNKWCNWIQACLKSSRGSILVNGLKINMSKSKIMEVHVEDAKVKHAASKLGCLTLKCPFTYLGTKVGGSMSRVEAWKDQAEQELLQTTRDFHSCNQEEGQPVSSYVLKMKGYIDNLEHLGHPVTLGLGVSLILIGLRKEYDGFVQNYNMHIMRKTVNELHTMLKLHEQTLSKNNALVLHSIRAGKVQKGHWKRNCPQYLAELLKKKKNAASGAGDSGIFLIELNTILNRSWIYDTGCGTHICNTMQGLRAGRKLKPGALSLYVGNGQREAVKAIGAFHLCLSSGLEIVLNNCHYAPSITRVVIFVFRLYEDGFLNRFTDNTIQVSRNNVVYFSAVLRDGIFEIDLSNFLTNESSIYAVRNKRAKLDLDSALLWNCRLGHISKKRIEKLQHDGLLDSSNLRAFEKCSYEVWHGQAPKLSYLKVWGCEALVKRDTLTMPDKLEPRSIKCIFIGYPKETMGYSFYYPPENKVLVAQNAEFLENSLITQEASGSLEDLKIIQEEDTHPYIDTSLNHEEDDPEIDEPQSDIVPIRRSTMTRHAPDLELPPNGKTVGSK
nr:nucleotide-binding alpha-beta plait domain-containing protein [Tanacetum cinerariifolium]